MNLSFSQKEKLAIGAALLILILYIVYAQFYYLSPLKSDLQNKQQSLKSEQQLLAALQKKSTSNNESVSVNTTELQKQVPVKSLQDQLILDLQQAETISNSKIKSMTFTDGGAVETVSSQPAAATTNSNQSNGNSSNGSAQTNSNSSSSAQQNSQNTSAQQQNSQTTSASSSQQSGQTTNGASAQQQTSSVSGLTKITVQLSIESPAYEDLENFINSLENMKRIIVVETISYTGSKEITSLSDNTQPMTYSLAVSAYYMPGLTDLQKQLPKADYPEPANKTNPQAAFADLTKAQ